MGDTIQAAISRLADYPAIARPGRVTGTRELLVVGTPYIVIYRIDVVRAASVALVAAGAHRQAGLHHGQAGQQRHPGGLLRLEAG
jgi:plasmid stabilization system protein ParE